MRAKDFMERVRNASMELQVLTEQKKAYREIATMTSPNLDRIGGKTGPSSRIENAAVEIADLTAEIDQKIAELTPLIVSAEEMIKTIPQDTYRHFLRLHYLCGLSMHAVSTKLHYEDPKSIYRVRAFALGELQKRM